MSLKIGALTFKHGLFLAPMAGVTDKAFRAICRRHGAEMTYTEMVSSKGIHFNDETTIHLSDIEEDEEMTSVQLFGHDAETMAEAILFMSKKREGLNLPLTIDINMGCPMKKIVNNGDGSALMKNPVLAGKIIRASKDKTDLPLTVKIRAGWDSDSINAVEIAKIAEENGADAITVHGRTREQMYCSDVNLDIIKEVKRAVKIPVIGNGGIFTKNDATKMISYTGCDGLMIARGSIGNPWLFEMISSEIEGKIYSLPDVDVRLSEALNQLEQMIKHKGQRNALLEGRRHIAYYIKDLRGASITRQKLNSAMSIDEIYSIINDYLKK